MTHPTIGTVRQLTQEEGETVIRALVNSSELVGEMVPIEELRRLRAIEVAARKVVTDYPCASGLARMIGDESPQDEWGYGSIRVLLLAINDPTLKTR